MVREIHTIYRDDSLHEIIKDKSLIEKITEEEFQLSPTRYLGEWKHVTPCIRDRWIGRTERILKRIIRLGKNKCNAASPQWHPIAEYDEEYEWVLIAYINNDGVIENVMRSTIDEESGGAEWYNWDNYCDHAPTHFMFFDFNNEVKS
jgi:hypothetical protein